MRLTSDKYANVLREKEYNFSYQYKIEYNEQKKAYFCSDDKNHLGVKEMLPSFIQNITSIVGENGAGKTTLLQAIAKDSFLIFEDDNKFYSSSQGEGFYHNNIKSYFLPSTPACCICYFNQDVMDENIITISETPTKNGFYFKDCSQYGLYENLLNEPSFRGLFKIEEGRNVYSNYPRLPLLKTLNSFMLARFYLDKINFIEKICKTKLRIGFELNSSIDGELEIIKGKEQIDKGLKLNNFYILIEEINTAVNYANDEKIRLKAFFLKCIIIKTVKFIFAATSHIDKTQDLISNEQLTEIREKLQLKSDATINLTMAAVTGIIKIFHDSYEQYANRNASMDMPIKYDDLFDFLNECYTNQQYEHCYFPEPKKILQLSTILLECDLHDCILISPYDKNSNARIDFSSGEKVLLMQYARIWTMFIPLFEKENNYTSSKFKLISHDIKNIILIFDEPDRGLHPRWQLQYFTWLFKLLKQINKSTHTDRKYQIIFTTNNPLMLSDNPSVNMMLNKEKDKVVYLYNTFGQNVYTLLRNPFFLQSTIGSYAKSSIDSVLEELMKEGEITEKTKTKIKIISDPIIKTYLQNKYPFELGENNHGKY